MVYQFSISSNTSQLTDSAQLNNTLASLVIVKNNFTLNNQYFDDFCFVVLGTMFEVKNNYFHLEPDMLLSIDQLLFNRIRGRRTRHGTITSNT